MNWLWMAVLRDYKTILGSDISLGGLTSQQMALPPLLMIYFSERMPSRVSKGGEQRMEQSSGTPGAHLQNALPVMSQATLNCPSMDL